MRMKRSPLRRRLKWWLGDLWHELQYEPIAQAAAVLAVLCIVAVLVVAVVMTSESYDTADNMCEQRCIEQQHHTGIVVDGDQCVCVDYTMPTESQ